jgi:hypothetical protein
MVDFRIVIGFAAFAFVVALLSGLIGGVSFGILVLRTFLGTALFAGLGAGVSWVFGRYLPEIFNAGEPQQTAGREEEPGEEVDIVLPEENPHEAGADELGGLETEEEAAAEGAAEVEDLDDFGAEDMSGELEEVEEGDAEDEGVAAETAADEPAEDVDGAEAASLDDGFAEFDSMPALDVLEQEEDPEEEALARTEEDPPGLKGGKNVDVMGSAHDPAEAAKAIKTWLRKDEKG